MNAPSATPIGRDAPAPMSVEAQLGLGVALLFVVASACWGLLPFTGHTFAAIVFLLFVVLLKLTPPSFPC